MGLIVPRRKKAVLIGRSEQDVRASGFAWVAREPQLMYGAKRARILTEINRLTQLDFPTKRGNRSPGHPQVTAFHQTGPNRTGQLNLLPPCCLNYLDVRHA